MYICIYICIYIYVYIFILPNIQLTPHKLSAERNECPQLHHCTLCPSCSAVTTEQNSLGAFSSRQVTWPLQDVVFYVEASVHRSLLLFANTPFVWAPPSSPIIAHTIAQYIISPRPPFIAIYAM